MRASTCGLVQTKFYGATVSSICRAPNVVIS
jgi:hypothetical protein